MSSSPKPATQPTTERKSKQAPSMSHDRIAADIAAFRKAGGRIEVLGNTRVLTRVEEPAKEDGKKPGK